MCESSSFLSSEGALSVHKKTFRNIINKEKDSEMNGLRIIRCAKKVDREKEKLLLRQLGSKSGCRVGTECSKRTGQRVGKGDEAVTFQCFIPCNLIIK